MLHLQLHLHLALCFIVSVFLCVLVAYTCILVKAMFRAASFGGQFALLVACHLYFLFFPYYLLIHLANKICSVLFCSVAVCELFSVKELCDLENRVRVRSRSLKMTPFDRSHLSSY